MYIAVYGFHKVQV